MINQQEILMSRQQGFEVGIVKDRLKTGSYLACICDTPHRIIKYLDQNMVTRVLKIFVFNDDGRDNKNQQIISIETQYLSIKKYLINRQRLIVPFAIDDLLSIQKQKTGSNVYLRVSTRFNEFPTLYDYLRELPFTQVKNSQLEEKREDLIYYFEELFQLFIGGRGGIMNFFYTPQNVFIVPPDKKIFRKLKLTLNFSSVAGLNFINLKTMPKQEFLEILPLLPPNVYQLLEQGQIHHLNFLIKVRAFAYLMLIWILGRVPVIEQIKNDIVQPSDSEIKVIVKGLGSRFKILLDLQMKTMKKVRKVTQIKILTFLKDVLVLNRIENWQTVHQLIFLKNYNNSHIQALLNNQIDKNQPISMGEAQIERNKLLLEHQIFVRMMEQIWRQESQKECYQRLRVGSGMVYLMCYLNSDFHGLLRHHNFISYMREEQFNLQSNKVRQQINKVLLRTDFLQMKEIDISKEQFFISIFGLQYEIKNDRNKNILISSMNPKYNLIKDIENSLWIS